MTKNIKLIEQQSLAEEFSVFKLNDARLLVTSAKEQQILKMQQTNSQNTPAQTDLFKDSRMQPINAEDKEESTQGQTDSRNTSLIDYHLDHGYQNFTYQLRGITREYLRPLTHIQNQPPMIQKSLQVDEMADLDTDHQEQLDSEAMASMRNRFRTDLAESAKDPDADIADTLREQISDGPGGFDEEYDVVDEDDKLL